MASYAAVSSFSPLSPDISIMAFVLPTGAVGASSFTGTRVVAPAVCANASMAMRAGGDAPATRRAVLAGALAAAGVAILPGSAMAKGGEGAKQSFFGAGSISNPFTYNEKSKGPVIYQVRTRVQRGHGGGLGCAVARILSLATWAISPMSVVYHGLFWDGVASCCSCMVRCTDLSLLWSA